MRFQGFHGRLLIVVDEAPGVKADIWEAIEGIRAGGDVRVLALGNPTIASGPFHDAFTSNRDGWCTFTISAFDSPNLAGLSLDELLALPIPRSTTAPVPTSSRAGGCGRSTPNGVRGIRSGRHASSGSSRPRPRMR